MLFFGILTCIKSYKVAKSIESVLKTMGTKLSAKPNFKDILTMLSYFWNASILKKSSELYKFLKLTNFKHFDILKCQSLI